MLQDDDGATRRRNALLAVASPRVAVPMGSRRAKSCSVLLLGEVGQEQEHKGVRRRRWVVVQRRTAVRLLLAGSVGGASRVGKSRNATLPTSAWHFRRAAGRGGRCTANSS